MYGVLVEVSPSGCKNVEVVSVEEHLGRYGRYEVIRDHMADKVLDVFERDNRRRYERRVPPFMDFSPNNPQIEKVIFNDPATIVIWSDGTKTVVKCQDGDTYDKELGLALCISKKFFGNKGNFNEVFKKWIPKDIVEKMRQTLHRYCDAKGYYGCDNCPLSIAENSRCGRGTTFMLKRNDGSYDMSDDEIRDAYNKVFNK